MNCKKEARMNIFESLENLNVSEECFNDVLNIVEKVIENTELIKQYGTTEVQKLPKEVRRMYYPTNKDDITNKKQKFGARKNARGHQQFSNYTPKSSKEKIEGSITRNNKKEKPLSYYLEKLKRIKEG